MELYNKLQKYVPPSWASALTYQPESYVRVRLLILILYTHFAIFKLWPAIYINPTPTYPAHSWQLYTFDNSANAPVQLAIRPTPIHHWDLPGVPKEFQVFIKRDDMTGSTLGGNKVC